MGKVCETNEKVSGDIFSFLHLNTSFREEDRILADRFVQTWRELVRQSTPLDVKKGQVLFYEGHAPCGVYVIASGTLKLKREEDGHFVGSLALFQPIGLDLLAGNIPYPYSAIAETDAKAYFIAKSDLAVLGIDPACGEG
jgi:CRP-like cAMP-binding protein